MRVPGFSAESTAYRTLNAYTGAPRPAIAGRVVPQQDNGLRGDPCRGACRCCAWYGYQGCCSVCDDCFVRHVARSAALSR
jgi:hypothetical protein